MQTLREIMGLRESVDIHGVEATMGTTVKVRDTGAKGVIRAIGRYGLVAVDGLLRSYSPDELEVEVDKPSLDLEPVRCQRCGKLLRKKESVEARMGDVCRKKTEELERKFAELAGQAQKEG